MSCRSTYRLRYISVAMNNRRNLHLRSILNNMVVTTHTKQCSWSRQTLFRVVRAQIFKRVGTTAVKLLFVPGLVEAFFDGAIAIPIFGMSATFGFALGFILKAVGPALVIQLMFETQSKRLGTAKGACLTTRYRRRCPRMR